MITYANNHRKNEESLRYSYLAIWEFLLKMLHILVKGWGATKINWPGHTFSKYTPEITTVFEESKTKRHLESFVVDNSLAAM